MNLVRHKMLMLLFLYSAVCFSQKALSQSLVIEREPIGGYNAFNKGNGVALVFQYGTDVPLSNLGLNYNMAPSYGLGVLKKVDEFTLNFNFNYHAYPVKNRSRGYVDNTFEVIGFYFGGAYDKMLAPNFKLYAGGDIGAWFKRADDLLESDDCDCDPRNVNYSFAPKTGVTYLLNNGIGVGLEAKYNLLLTGHDYVTGERGGMLFNSLATSIMISYHF